MEPVTSLVDKLKSLAKSSHDFVDTHVLRRNPIEILKRLQRESFSDIMKLRDRQDKVERMITFYRSSNGNPFQEASTRVRGEVDVLGAVLMMDNVDELNLEVLSRAGIRTGIVSRFTFETIVRQTDTLIAEFVASQKGARYVNDAIGSCLSLSKVCYNANVNDWLSVAAIPIGAQCRDVGYAYNSSQPVKGLTDFSSFGPNIMSQHNGSALGVTVRKLSITASLAQFISGLGTHPGLDGAETCFSSFGKVVCQLSRGTRVSLLGLHQVSESSSKYSNLGPLAIPLRFLKQHEDQNTSIEVLTPSGEPNMLKNVSAGSMTVMLESEYDESLRFGGWVEMKQQNPRQLQWAVSVSDTPDNELGWGLSFGGNGTVEDRTSWERFQAECFLKFNFGGRFKLQPGLVYIADGTSRLPAVMLRSSWEL